MLMEMLFLLIVVMHTGQFIKWEEFMDREKFLKSIYLGDRYCTSEVYDEKKKLYQIHMNCISRIRSNDGEWDFYTDEDIENGIISFEGVDEIVRENEIELNDEIYEIEIVSQEKDFTQFCVHGSNVNDEAITTDVNVFIKAKSISLINPQNPKVRITE